MTIPERFLSGVLTLAIGDTQWGDTGKGKFVDLFAEWAEIIARGTGGANSGHTVSFGGKEYVFHLVPSGILHDGDGKINVIGNGVAFDPQIACEELDVLEREEVSYDHLLIAHNAHLTLPQHIVVDRAKESRRKGRIGTTGRGIGPTYVDHYARIGLVVNDLLNRDRFREKLEENLRDKVRFLMGLDRELVKTIMEHEDLGGGQFYSPRRIFDVDAIVEQYTAYGERLRLMIRDTGRLLREDFRFHRKLLEGAQGNLLSVDRGTYPYVTSSDCSTAGLAKGVGLNERDVDLALGIVKAFYMTRVGEGPFPTEFGGERSARWCNSRYATKAVEQQRYARTTVNSTDEFAQGVAVRLAGNEYGRTTERPRRDGWLDMALARYSREFTGPNIILTKLDVLDQCETIKICRAYTYRGPPYTVGERTFREGDILTVAVPDYEVLRYCQPLYDIFEGWQSSIGEIRAYEDLPQALKRLVAYVEEQGGFHVVGLSVGPDREQTIWVKNPVQ